MSVNIIVTVDSQNEQLLEIESIPTEELRELASKGNPRMYAILDACDQPEVLEKVAELGERAVCLYIGRAGAEWADVAPYLVEVDGELLLWIIDTLWDEPWGILISSSAEFETLRRHFRTFLLVRDSDGKEMVFRYYDPRILSVYLPTCTEDELETVFGPVHKFWAQAIVGEEIAMHSMK